MPHTVFKGSHGIVVRELQGNLARSGVPIKIDGVFGPETEAAVRRFQTGAHLPADGVVGARTWAALHGAPATPRRAADRAPMHDSMVERVLKDVGQWWDGVTAPAATASASAPSTRPASVAPRAAASTPRAAPSASSAPAGAPHLATFTDSSRYQRIRFDGYEGRGWVVKGFEELRGKQIHEIGGGRFAINPVGASPLFHNNECVALVKYFGLPATSTWRRGPQVCDFAPGTLPVGTVVATLRDGAYHSDYSGRSHVGIYISHDDHASWSASSRPNAGVQLFEQWNKAIIGKHPIKRYAVNADAIGNKARKAWRDGSGQLHTRRVSWTADGEEYYVVMTK